MTTVCCSCAELCWLCDRRWKCPGCSPSSAMNCFSSPHSASSFEICSPALFWPELFGFWLWKISALLRWNFLSDFICVRRQLSASLNTLVRASRTDSWKTNACSASPLPTMIFTVLVENLYHIRQELGLRLISRLTAELYHWARMAPWAALSTCWQIFD